MLAVCVMIVHKRCVGKGTIGSDVFTCGRKRVSAIFTTEDKKGGLFSFPLGSPIISNKSGSTVGGALHKCFEKFHTMQKKLNIPGLPLLATLHSSCTDGADAEKAAIRHLNEKLNELLKELHEKGLSEEKARELIWIICIMHALCSNLKMCVFVNC